MKTVHDILDYCRKITAIKEDFVVVGSTALYIQGRHIIAPNDLDIVVCNVSDLGYEKDLHHYKTDSPYSVSGKRACILQNGITIIDIFVEDYLPEYEIIKGIRIETLSGMRLYYENLLKKVAEPGRGKILDKLNALNYGKW